KGAYVGDFTNALRIPGNNLAGGITRSRDELADELHRNLSGRSFEFCFNNLSLVDADKALIDLLASALTLCNGSNEAVEDLPAQQVLQQFAIAFGKRHHDHFIG